MLTASEFYRWLLSLVQDGGAKALMELVEFVQGEDELLMTGPATAALLCWGERGCEAVVRIALVKRTSKSISSAYKILAAAATGDRIEPSIESPSNRDNSAAVRTASISASLSASSRALV
jgi:hypothetical protein